MNKKLVLISIGALIIIAGSMVSILLLIKSQTKASVVSTSSAVKLSPDGSRDYGACVFVSKDLVKSTIGAPAANLKGPDTVGLALLANGDQVQLCSYSFVTGGTAANQFNANNGFTVEVFIHKDKASRDAFIALQDKSSQLITILGKSAAYKANKFSDGHISYRLVVYSDLRHYTFSINQPSDQKKFTDDSARDTLVTIAKSASY